MPPSRINGDGGKKDIAHSPPLLPKAAAAALGKRGTPKRKALLKKAPFGNGLNIKYWLSAFVLDDFSNFVPHEVSFNIHAILYVI